MATNFCDALQIFQGGTGGSSTTENTLVLPEGSATLSDLIKLNYDFPVEPNVPTPPSYNIYIYNNNTNGEIRFYTKDAKSFNDYNKDYFSGNYSNPRLNYNTKIGNDGKLYYWHNYTVANPTKLSGWNELDGNFNSIEIQLTVIDLSLGTLLTLEQALQTQLNTTTTGFNGKFALIDSLTADHEVRLNFIEFSPIEDMNIFDWNSTEYDAMAIFRAARRDIVTNSRRKIKENFNAAFLRGVIKRRNVLANVLQRVYDNSLNTIGAIAFASGVYLLLREILDVKKAEAYKDELLGIADTLGQLEISQNNDTLNHLGLTIVSGNGGFPPSLPNIEYTVPIQREAILKFGIDASFNAYLITVEQYGATFFSVGETISINKNLINGGSGTLVLTVSSLGTLKQWTELRQTYLQNKLNKINTKSRRKNYIVGHDDINTNQFTNVVTTYTDYDEIGAETISYKVLKSRINLLPSGVEDVDLYSTGKVGIGTANPTTKLHIFDNINNDTKIIIQNTSNILLDTPSSSSIDLLITDNTVADYNVGNYNGNFKIKGNETDRVVINSAGRVGIGISPHEVHKLNVDGTIISTNYVGYYVGAGKLSSSIEILAYKATDPTIRIESGATGTPILEFMRGATQDAYKDYRFVTENEMFKLQYQNDITNYDNATNQLMAFDDDETIIYKPTEFKSNVIVSGDTRTIGYVGIGTTGATTLHTYNAAANILRLQTAPVDGTNSIEFVRGSTSDPLNDYRLHTDTAGKFKIQYSTNVLAYGGTGSDLINLSATNINLYKNTEITGNVGIGTTPHTTYAFDTLGTSRFTGNVGVGTTPHETYKVDVLGTSRYTGNVGVGTTPHETYKVDVLGDIKATEFRGGGANITGLALENIPDIPATKITSGTLHNDRLSLTGQKVYDGCENTTFILNPSNKVDIPPVYSFNITAFDRLANTTATYLEAGKFTCTYEDRNGTYKLIPSYIPNPNNKVILNYRVGDKIVFKHTANTQYDYTEVPQQRWARLSVFKMPSNIAWTSQGQEISYMTPVIDWDSDSSSVLDWTGISVAVYPRNTPVTMQIQAGFKYFFVKWQRNNDANLYDSYITPATEASGMNIAYGGGQGFKISGDYSGSGGYKPTSSSLPPLMTTDTEGTARRGSRLSIDNGVLSADIPTSTDLITNMNTSHFTNNVATSKIDISSSYVAPNATKLATSRNIAGVGFDGSAAIDIPYGNLTSVPATWADSQIPNLGAGKITSGTFTTDRIPDLGAGKITSGTFDVLRIPDLATTKITSGTFDVLRIPDLATTKITSGTFDVLRIPDLATTKITSGTFDVLRIPDLATTKITSGTFDVLRIPDLATTKITSGTFDVLRIPDLATTKITSGTFDVLRIPDLATTKITSGTFDVLRIPDLATTKITSGTFDVLRIPDLATTKITSGTFDVLRIPDLATTKITSGTFDVLRIPDLAITKISGLQGELDAKQATINSTAGQLIIGNGNGLTSTNTGLTWTTATNLLTATNFSGNGSSISSLNMGNAGSGTLSVSRGGSGAGTFTAGGLLIGNTTSAFSQATGLTWTTATNLLTATNIAGDGSGITALNMGNAGSGTLAVARGGTGAGTFTLGGLLIGNSTSVFSQATGLTWTTATNLLTATNIAGAGSGITALNMGNAGSGILSVSRGGTGTDTLSDTSILVGAGANGVQTYGTLTYDYTNRTLKSDRITGYLPYTSTNPNITDASVYISSTPTTDASLTKNIKTKNGEYIISASSAGFKLENIYDNNSATTWQTGTNSYVKQASGFWTTGTNFPTTHLFPTTTIYGEWIQVKFPRRTCVDDIRVLPLAGATYPNSIYEWYLLATNDVTGTNWIRIYYNFKTFITSSEQNLLPALGNTNTTQYLYYRLVVNKILGTAGSATGSTLSLVFLNLRFVIKDTLMYNDAVVLIGEPISTTPAINTILNVNGGVDINGDLNVAQGCSIRVGGTAIANSWSAGTPTTNIYYNLGNVGIGAIATSAVDNTNSAFAIPTATLFVKGGATAGGTCDVVIKGGLSGQINGKAKLWLSADAFHSSYIQSEHTGYGNTLLTFGTANGNALPTERMKINYNGAVGIQNNGYAIPNNYMSAGSLTIGNISQNYGGGNNWTTNTAGLIMECLDNTEIVIHDSGNSLHSFMYYTTNGNFRIGRNMGYGNGNLIVSGYIESDATILSRNAVYARNSFDVIMYADGGGMYFKFGTINTANSDYLEISASGGTTNFNSGSSRDMFFRTNGYRWLFQNNGWSWNGVNTNVWSSFSDHRIKENIKKANLQTCYDNVKNINLYRYNYIDGFSKGVKQDRTQLGYIAQQVHQHFPKSVSRTKTRIEDKREIPDLCGVNTDQVNYTLFGAVKQLMKVVEKQSRRIKKLEEMLGIIDDDVVENDADEPYERIVCDEVDIDTIEPSEPEGV